MEKQVCKHPLEYRAFYSTQNGQYDFSCLICGEVIAKLTQKQAKLAGNMLAQLKPQHGEWS